MQSIKLKMEESQESESRSTATAQFFDGRRGVSVEDRSKRAETVRPQVNKRREKRRECDSALSATIVENGDELNGETDDEDIEDGERGFDDGSAQVRYIRDPGQPNAKEHHEHMTADHGANSV